MNTLFICLYALASLALLGWWREIQRCRRLADATAASHFAISEPPAAKHADGLFPGDSFLARPLPAEQQRRRHLVIYSVLLTVAAMGWISFFAVLWAAQQR